jgi:hypothetical protein
MKLAVLGLVMVSGTARADWHAGANLRADSGAHPIRAGAGLDEGAFDISLALDPMIVFDGQMDTDVLATKRVSDGDWGVFGGWRTSMIGIAGGRQFQEKAVVGLSGALPEITCALRARWSFELATVVVKHGAGLPTDWISFAEGRDFVDLVNFGMFVTVEYVAH